MATDDRVLITGISGFIAGHTALAVLRAGFRVRGTVRSVRKGAAVLASFARLGVDPARVEIVEADLGRDEGWDAAARGCRAVLHIASPFPGRVPKDRLALVPVARDGTLRVLVAAKRAGAERVVLTSSVAAVYYGHKARGDRPFTEADWTDTGSPETGPYALSKTLAERAAWEFSAAEGLDLVALNPSVVLGPLLDAEHGTSIALLRSLMSGRFPLVPRIALGIVDVRDVAQAHLAAITEPRAAGRRFILSAGSRSLLELGQAVAAAAPNIRWRLPKAALPDAVLRVLARVVPEAAQALPELGRRKELVARSAEEILGVTFRSPEEAVAATVRSLRGASDRAV